MASRLAGSSIIQPEIELMDVGKKLLRLPSSNAELLNVLARMEQILSRVQQFPSKSMQYAMNPIIEAFSAKELLRHSDMNVNVSVACCICEILRIMAPNAPYNDQQMKDFFELVVITFEKLSFASGGCCTNMTKVLETFSTVRLSVLMLDLKLDDLVIRLFKQFLNVADSNSREVVSEMEKIMTMIIDESEILTLELVGLLVKSVKKDNQNQTASSTVCWQLGEKVLMNCACQLKPYLQDTEGKEPVVVYNSLRGTIQSTTDTSKFRRDTTHKIGSSSQMIQNEDLYLASSKFESLDDLLQSVRAFYYTKGYGISIRNSKKDKFVILQCDRGGSYRDIRCIGDKREKSIRSRLTNCPFRIVGKKENDGVWVFKEKDLEHNHEPYTNMYGYPSFRRLSADNIQSVKEMTLQGIPPKQILSSLREQTPNLPAISRTIYNLKAKIRKDNLGNRTMVSALFEELKKGGFSYDILHNSEGHISSLFIAHPLSVKLSKVFSNIFVMDCTCKSNKYNMPLLDIIGVSCFNTSFYSGFAFLEKADEENYNWALNAFKKILGLEDQPFVIISDRELALMNAIKNVFPTATNLLSVWHIQKNMLNNCKKHFRHAEEFDIFMSSWNNVIHSTTEAFFVKNWGEFELFYKDKKDAIEYLKTTWLPWKEKFVGVWTEKYLHFGNRLSSRAEAAHAKLKQFLQEIQISNGGPQEVKDKICLAIEHEFNEIKEKLASERVHVPHDCNMLVFRELVFNVSQFALEEIYKQYEKIKDGTLTPWCTGHFMATMGLPCAHKIEDCREMTLSLELIHPQWRIDTISLNLEDDLQNDGANRFVNLLNELYTKYQEWPLNKKEYATLMLTKLVNESDTFSRSAIQQSNGNQPKSKRRRTSTTRDPPRFELVESSPTQNPSSSTFVFQRNNEQ